MEMIPRLHMENGDTGTADPARPQRATTKTGEVKEPPVMIPRIMYNPGTGQAESEKHLLRRHVVLKAHRHENHNR